MTITLLFMKFSGDIEKCIIFLAYNLFSCIVRNDRLLCKNVSDQVKIASVYFDLRNLFPQVILHIHVQRKAHKRVCLYIKPRVPTYLQVFSPGP